MLESDHRLKLPVLNRRQNFFEPKQRGVKTKSRADQALAAKLTEVGELIGKLLVLSQRSGWYGWKTHYDLYDNTIGLLLTTEYTMSADRQHISYYVLLRTLENGKKFGFVVEAHSWSPGDFYPLDRVPSAETVISALKDKIAELGSRKPPG